MNESYITDIAFINSNTRSGIELNNLFIDGFFSNEKKWETYNLSNDIQALFEGINSRLKNRMSQLSLGVYNVLENGPGKSLKEDEEIFLFTGFGEIDTTDKIIKSIILEKFNLVSPTLFHNSVHHTSLGYYTIIKKIHNTCATISDGVCTNLSFINYIKKRSKINKPFVVVGGEEYSEFYKMDKINNYKIVPAFVSYRITQDKNKGFIFCGILNNLEELSDNDSFKRSRTLITDKNAFLKLKKNIDKKVLTEYPLVLDNPCGIILRLAFPFYFNIKGTSLVIEEINNKFYCFEVNL